MISNYIDPESKLVLKINCSATEVNFFINKIFTKEICIVVGEENVVTPEFTRISDIEFLKKDYIEYCNRLHTELNQNPVAV